jgi:hypothetical protein
MDIPRQQIWLSGRKVDVKDCATFRLSILRTRTTEKFKFDAQRVMCNEVKDLKINRFGWKKKKKKKQMQFYFAVKSLRRCDEMWRHVVR